MKKKAPVYPKHRRLIETIMKKGYVNPNFALQRRWDNDVKMRWNASLTNRVSANRHFV